MEGRFLDRWLWVRRKNIVAGSPVYHAVSQREPGGAWVRRS